MEGAHGGYVAASQSQLLPVPEGNTSVASSPHWHIPWKPWLWCIQSQGKISDINNSVTWWQRTGQSFLAAAAGAACELGGEERLPAQAQTGKRRKKKKTKQKIGKSSTRLQNQMGGCLHLWEFAVPWSWLLCDTAFLKSCKTDSLGALALPKISWDFYPPKSHFPSLPVPFLFHTRCNLKRCLRAVTISCCAPLSAE